MRPLLVLVLLLAAAAPQRPAAKSSMLADAEARPKLAVAAVAKPMRLVEEPPAGMVELMLQDREKIAPLSVLRKTPPELPAQITAGLLGATTTAFTGPPAGPDELQPANDVDAMKRRAKRGERVMDFEMTALSSSRSQAYFNNVVRSELDLAAGRER